MNNAQQHNSVRGNSESVRCRLFQKFRHDNNICACAISALILFPVVNLLLESGNRFSDIDFLYDVEIFAARRCFWSILAISQLTCAVLTLIIILWYWPYDYTSVLKSGVIFKFSSPVFL